MRSAVDRFIAELSGQSMERADGAVRVLLVEDSSDFATRVEIALCGHTRARFEVFHAHRLDSARCALETEGYDAMLVDLGPSDADRRATIDAASTLATRLPVIVMTGARASGDAPSTTTDEVVFKQRFDRADLPGAILRAIDRHRRLGSVGQGPVICRIPEC